jgi:hypothetical protein
VRFNLLVNAKQAARGIQIAHVHALLSGSQSCAYAQDVQFAERSHSGGTVLAASSQRAACAPELHRWQAANLRHRQAANLKSVFD